MNKYFRLKSSKGGVLIEFSMSALLFLTVLFGTLEWSLEIHARQSTERALAASLAVYSISRDEAESRSLSQADVVGFVGRCLSSEYKIYDSIQGIDLLSSATGRSPAGDASDNSAAFVKVTMTCDWPRLTPLTASILGSELIYTVSGISRIQS